MIVTDVINGDETGLSNQLFGKVKVTDDDNNPITSVETGSYKEETGTFYMKGDEIYHRKPLDYEKQNHYSMEITVYDITNLPAKYFSKVINITINDVNEPPVINKDVNNITIRENDIEVFNISAHDEDSGRNGELSFSVIQDSRIPKFGLENQTLVVKKLAGEYILFIL